ncbi:MAG: heat-inducible transcriptional repressor HrcA [Erysipelotrichaceae bacterium]|nr:heat-inducible transcriptional repressor HrcA [Erysipelotrichaceae bacterium]
MLTNRRSMILKAIVEEFIKTAEPVGSKTLMAKYDLPYSSATIRNEMMYLEEQGLLEKTHTSSGRIPSTEGYRYYVENLMETELDAQDKYELQNLFMSDRGSMEDVIQMSCDVLSHMTNLTSIVLGPDAKTQRLHHIKLFPVDEHTAVAVFITDQGHTENKTFHFDDLVSIEDITNCCNILNDRLVGTELSRIVDKMNEIKPILANQVKRHEILFNAFLQAFIRFANENVYYSGASNMLYQPEFADIEKLRNIMRMLEDGNIWREITSNEQMRALTTGKSELVWLDDMAVVSTSFRMNDVEEGKLMIVGPSRMNYDKITSMLDYVGEILEKKYYKK